MGFNNGGGGPGDNSNTQPSENAGVLRYTYCSDNVRHLVNNYVRTRSSNGGGSGNNLNVQSSSANNDDWITVPVAGLLVGLASIIIDYYIDKIMDKTYYNQPISNKIAEPAAMHLIIGLGMCAGKQDYIGCVLKVFVCGEIGTLISPEIEAKISALLPEPWQKTWRTTYKTISTFASSAAVRAVCKTISGAPPNGGLYEIPQDVFTGAIINYFTDSGQAILTDNTKRCSVCTCEYLPGDALVALLMTQKRNSNN